jgi:hypothetical protein
MAQRKLCFFYEKTTKILKKNDSRGFSEILKLMSEYGRNGDFKRKASTKRPQAPKQRNPNPPAVPGSGGPEKQRGGKSPPFMDTLDGG